MSYHDGPEDGPKVTPLSLVPLSPNEGCRPAESFTPFSFEELSLEESITINDIPHFTRKAIGVLLEYAEPRKSISKLIKKNPHIQRFASVVNLATDQGARQIRCEVEVYNPVGLQLIINKSSQPKALRFQEAVAHLVYAYTTGKLSLPQPQSQPQINVDCDEYLALLKENNALLKFKIGTFEAKEKKNRNRSEGQKKRTPLTNEIIAKIYKLKGKGKSYREISDEIHVSPSTISHVLTLRPPIPMPGKEV